MKKITILILNILVVSGLYAQSIKGIIKNQAGEGIFGASVVVLNTSKEWCLTNRVVLKLPCQKANTMCR